MLSSWMDEAWRGRAVPWWPSKAIVTAVTTVMRRIRPQGRIRVSRVSAEWLRAFEHESSKHHDGP